MVKLRSNKGFTLIEMIFVLMIVSILVCCTTFHVPNQDKIQIYFLEEKLKETQLKSLVQMEKHEIFLENSTLWIDERSYDLSPLVCETTQFHYNEKGHISQADSFECEGRKIHARFVVQLEVGGCVLKCKGYLLAENLLLFAGVMLLVVAVCSCLVDVKRFDEVVASIDQKTYEERLKAAYE